MINKKLFLGLSIFFLIYTATYSQVYRITNNLEQDRNPRIVRDLNNRIWCFWESGAQQDYQIKASYFENGQWSVEQVIAEYSNHYYDIDLDRESGKIWVIVTYYSDSVKIYSGQINGFSEVGTYVNYNGYNLSGTTFNVIDSLNIWMDLTEGVFNFLIHFNGLEFSEFETQGLEPGLCFYNKRPKSSVLINSNKIYYTRFGDWGCSGGGGSGFFDYLFYIDLTDTLFLENIISMSLYSEASTLGMDADSYIYFFNVDYNDSSTQNNLALVDFEADTVIRKIQNLNFFPHTASKYDTICVTGWISDTTICYKALNDTVFYKTKCISNSELFNVPNLYNLKIEKGVGNIVWLTWSAYINNQFEIFAAKKEFSTEIDTNYVVSVCNDEELVESPTSFELLQNYPNPFNSLTTIKFNNSFNQHITIKVFDVLGNEVETLINDYFKSGNHSINFIAKNLTSGVYFYSVYSENYYGTKKMILLK